MQIFLSDKILLSSFVFFQAVCLACFIFQKSVSIQQRRDEAAARVLLKQILINCGGFKNKRTVAKHSLH